MPNGLGELLKEYHPQIDGHGGLSARNEVSLGLQHMVKL